MSDSEDDFVEVSGYQSSDSEWEKISGYSSTEDEAELVVTPAPAASTKAPQAWPSHEMVTSYYQSPPQYPKFISLICCCRFVVTRLAYMFG